MSTAVWVTPWPDPMLDVIGHDPRNGQHLARSLTRPRRRSLMESMRTLALLFVVAAVGFPVAPSGAATNPQPPSETFDTDFDGKVDFTIYDTNFDGVFEWPSGSKSVPWRARCRRSGRHGGQRRDYRGHDRVRRAVVQRAGCTPGATSRFRPETTIFITGDTDLTLTAAFKATAPSLIAFDVFDEGVTQRITAKSISITSLFSTVYVVNFNTDVSNPLVFLSADSISLVGKKADAGLDVEGASLAARKITLEVPATNSAFSQITVSESVLDDGPGKHRPSERR